MLKSHRRGDEPGGVAVVRELVVGDDLGAQSGDEADIGGRGAGVGGLLGKS